MARPRPRARGRRALGRRLLLVCEGLRDEYEYLRSVRRDFRLPAAGVVIESARGGSPTAIVRRAIERSAELGLGADRAESLDEAWVVFDVEAQPTVAAEAADAALRAGLRVAISHPCFETWLLLHDGTQGASMTARQAKRRCMNQFGIPGNPPRPPQLDDSRLPAPWTSAALNAESCRARTASDEGLDAANAVAVVLARNPGSNLDELIRALARSRAGTGAA